ncbi:MAG: hypothetical protein Q9180_009035, partial [Flavoplaca navasiana]
PRRKSIPAMDLDGTSSVSSINYALTNRHIPEIWVKVSKTEQDEIVGPNPPSQSSLVFILAFIYNTDLISVSHIPTLQQHELISDTKYAGDTPLGFDDSEDSSHPSGKKIKQHDEGLETLQGFLETR